MSYGLGCEAAAGMAKDVHYNAAEHIAAETAADPYLRPSFAASDRARRLLWNLCRTVLYRPSPRPMHAWRAFLLRRFGATMGPNCHFYPSSRVWAPWNLVCADQVTAGDGAEIYNPAPAHLDRTPSCRRSRTCAARPTTWTMRDFRCWPTRWRLERMRGCARVPRWRRA